MTWYRKYRERTSPRTRGWDYGQTAAYFITICTGDRRPYFGDIQDGIMGLSHIGLIANWFWQQIPQQFPHIELDEYIIMPNHLHGILIIYNNRDAINRVPMYDGPVKREPVDSAFFNNPVDIKFPVNLPGGATGLYNPMLSKGNLGRVLRWYKGRCSYEIHQRNYPEFQWQGRYWDHIIEDEKSLDYIREYIFNNPLNWESDRFYEE